MTFRRALAVSAAALIALTTAACGQDDGEEPLSDDALVIYSGRNENLVAPILEKLEDETGIDVQVRYGGSSELAAQLLEEGDGTKADLFFSQDAGALGALAKAGRLETLARRDDREGPGSGSPTRPATGSRRPPGPASSPTTPRRRPRSPR